MLKGEIINGGSIVSGGLVFQQNAKLPGNALKSVDFITVVDILSEGEIEGSATASKAGLTDKTSTAYKNAFLKDVFLNDQPVLVSDADVNNPVKSDKNFETVKLQFREGTANQTKLPGKHLFPSTELQKADHGDIGEIVDFPKDGSVTTRSVTISDVNVDIVKVRVGFTSFFKIDNKGKRKATKVKVQIKVNPNNGSQITVIGANDSEIIEGKSLTAYNRDYGIRLENLAGYNTNTPGESGSFFPITVTLTRTNSEGVVGKSFNQMKLAGVSTIVEESHTYPHVAHTSLRFSAEEFPAMPSRIFRIRGKKVKIPHNATVDLATGRITYSGDFNGSFKTDREWTSDPAWILYDLLVTNSERTDQQQYGCKLPESSIDKFVFQKASEYCGELVDDGNGGTEPRFSLNVNIRTQVEALKLIFVL